MSQCSPFIAHRSLTLVLAVMVSMNGCGRDDTTVSRHPLQTANTGSAASPSATGTGLSAATVQNAPFDLDAVLAGIPDDATPLRQKLQREFEVAFVWDDRDEGKVLVAQLGFRPKLGDADLVALAGLEGSLDLILTGTPISDRGLALLARMRTTQRNNRALLGEIWELSLAYTKISDAGLTHLATLTSLRGLDLTRTAVTDAGLAHLAKLTNLRRLILARTQVKGAGLQHLRSLTALTELDLEGTAVNDEGLHQLPVLPQLRKLVLRASRITDTGLSRLKELPALEELDITQTLISDGCVAYLKELKKLRRLRVVDKTGLTERGAMQLRLALPESVRID
ncbi:hypothetical protein HRbin36_00814 [bacterium HR36]|nr:hypothetical protein HRbin36_00814 [bacterium HR36]